MMEENIKLACHNEFPLGKETVKHILQVVTNGSLDGFANQLPFIHVSPITTAPCDLHFYICAKEEPWRYSFLTSMIKRWLIPGRELEFSMQLGIDFKLPKLLPDPLFVAHLIVGVNQEHDLKLIKANLPLLLAELRLSMSSAYHARRLLETKGLDYSEKTSLVQGSISHLIKRRPGDFDFDIISDMQRFLVLSKEDFKRQRSSRHLARIISFHYLFRKALKLSLDAFPNRRYVSVKVIHTKLHDGKSVVGIVVALSFLKENEVFEARHVLNAVKVLIPDANKVDGSFFLHPPRSDGIHLLYLEIEKASGDFSKYDIRLLKHELESDLEGKIEQRHNPLFMPTNEEMVMRHIVTLSHQLTTLKDLPQVMVEFSKQTEDELEFRVIMLRVKTLSHPPIRHLFELNKNPSFTFLFDRRKNVGMIRKKYKKEANVFYLSLNKRPFLRQDHSIDLYRARGHVVHLLRLIVGEFRDYNGGIISKETELLEALKEQLGDLADENHFLLENFFFGLHPPVMRSVMPAEALVKLFRLVIEAKIEGLPGGEAYQIRINEDRSNYYLLVLAKDLDLLEDLPHQDGLNDSHSVATCLIEEAGLPCFGVICRHHDPEAARELWQLLETKLDQKMSLLSR